MDEIRGVFFWFNGVVLPPLNIVLCKLLQPRGVKTSVLMQAGFQALCEDMAVGTLDGLAFCQKLVEMFVLDMPPTALEQEILAAMLPNPDIIVEIEKLPGEYQRWLVVDLPQSWFEHLAERSGVNSCFVKQQVISLEKSGLPRLLPDVFYYLSWVTRIPLKQCLLFHASTHWSVLALEHGLNAAIFVDAIHLKREFLLRRMTDKYYRVH